MHINEIKQQLEQGAMRVVDGNKVAYPTIKEKRLIGCDIYRKTDSGYSMWKRVAFR